MGQVTDLVPFFQVSILTLMHTEISATIYIFLHTATLNIWHVNLQLYSVPDI